MAGLPSYAFGGWPIGKSPTKFLVNNVALTSNVATITGTVVEGDIPIVGALITVTGTQNTAGLFNVTAVAITGVTITASTGAGTITYALTHANVASTADAGVALAPQPETSESLTNGASVPFTMPFQDPKTDGARTLNVVINFPSLPTTATVDLQAALMDQDSEYLKVGNVATVSGGAVTQGPAAQFTLNQARFYRLNVSNVTGGSSPTIIAKIQA